MSDGGWRANVAIGLALFTLLVVVLFAAGLSAIDLPTLDYPPEESATETHSGDPREREDTEAQIWMAWASWTQVLVSVLGLIGLGATVIFAALAWREALQANADARSFFAEERRAWLAPDAKINGWYVPDGDPKTAHVSVTLTAKNVGVTPAKMCVFHIPATGLPIFAGGELAAFRAEIKAHKEARPGDFIGETIFPNTERPVERSAIVTIRLPVLFNVAGPAGRVLRSARFYLPMWVSYFYAGSEVRHISPMVLEGHIDWHEASNEFRQSFQPFPVNLESD